MPIPLPQDWITPALDPNTPCYYDMGRASYVTVNDERALHAFHLVSRLEGIIPALETSHALAHLIDNPHEFNDGDLIMLNLSGRGDKDAATVSALMQDTAS